MPTIVKVFSVSWAFNAGYMKKVGQARSGALRKVFKHDFQGRNLSNVPSSDESTRNI
jgi:hypothetical protein